MGTIMRPLVLSYSFLILLLTVVTVCGQPYGNPLLLTPPAGNSPHVVFKTASAYMVYTCVEGAWKAGNGYATLLDKSTNKVVGNYTCAADQSGHLSTWTLANSIGDALESGDYVSKVSARSIALSYNGNYANLPSELFEAESHENSGAAAGVSYAQIYSTVGGVAPPQETCSTTVFSKTVPFQAEFCLWTQDSVPVSVPADISSPGRVVDGFFAKGLISYTFNGSVWVDSDKTGLLYNLPGTPAIGKFWVKDGVECWDIYNPNGFTVYGVISSLNWMVAGNSYAWSLSTVTTQSLSSFLGPFGHVQMTSTRGGIPPTTTSAPPVTGTVSKVPFSSIYWLYQQT